MFQLPVSKNLWSIAAAALVSVVVILGFGIFKYQREYSQRLKELDRDLRSAALAANFIVGTEFHSQNMTAESYNEEQDRALAELLTEYALSQDFKYVYTMILDEGVIRFTSSSLTPEEIAGSPRQTFYWTTYSEADPALYDVFASGQPAFVNYTDRWGDFRSYFVYYPNPAGQDYVIGVDVNLAELYKIRRKAVQETLLLLSVITFLLVLWIWTSAKQQAAIVLNNRRYNIALSVASIGIWEWDISKKSFYISPTFFQSLGYSRDDIPHTLEEIHSFIHPRDVGVFRDSMHEALLRNAPDEVYIDFELRMLDAAGKYVWMRTQGKTVKWRNNGKPALRTGVIENTNALKLTQGELRDSRKSLVERERFLNTLLASLPDFVGFKNTEGVYSAASNTFENIFGVASKDLLGKTDYDLVPFHIAESFRENDIEAMSSPTPIRVEEWLVFSSDNKSHLLETFKTRVMDDEDRFLGVLSIGRDITESYELITELQKFQRFAEYSGQGMCIVSLDAQINYVNPLFTQLLGKSDNKSKSAASLYEFYPSTTQETIQSSIIPKVKKGETWKGELPMLNAEGTVIPTLQAFFAILSEQGMPLYIGVIVTDISEQKAFELELAQAKENAEFANHSKSAFLANISHEIRTPMNAVLGYTQLLLANDLNDEVRKQLDHVYQAGQRLLGLINDVLDLSKIEAGKFRLSVEVFDLRRELLQIFELMRKQTRGQEVQLVENIQLPQATSICSDRKKIGQIVMNLLSNAIKFTHQGQVTLECSSDDESVSIVVQDTGVGISIEDQKRLFEPFTQGAEGEKSGGGTGLGLILSKRMAEEMGGTLTLKSEKGKGTRVTFYLPGKTGQEQTAVLQEQVAGEQQLEATSSCCALVVDDDLDSRNVLSGLLSTIGCETIVFESGAAALASLKNKVVDIIFTDIRMPGISGIDLLNRVKESTDTQLKSLPVVAVSASTLEHESSYFMSLGFDDFISKPVIRKEIVRALKLHTDARFKESGTAIMSEADVELPLLSAADICDADKQVLLIIKSASKEGDPDGIKTMLDKLTSEFKKSRNYRELLEAVRKYDFVLLEKLINRLG